MSQNEADAFFMDQALEQAWKSYGEGGLPIGAVMVLDGEVIGAGHNRRVQDGDPIAHGEMSCLRDAGRRPSYAGVTLYTTLSPCMMCSGTVVQFGIPRVVVGENRNFAGDIEFLRSHGIEVELLNDPGCEELMGRFISEKPALWSEDIAGRSDVETSGAMSVRLTRDEALVLFEVLARWEDAGELDILDSSEERALLKVKAQLDRGLVEPFDADYRAIIERARDRLRDG